MSARVSVYGLTHTNAYDSNNGTVHHKDRRVDFMVLLIITE